MLRPWDRKQGFYFELVTFPSVGESLDVHGGSVSKVTIRTFLAQNAFCEYNILRSIICNNNSAAIN